MSRQKKSSKVLNINLQTDIYEQLERYCQEKGQTKTLAVERILSEHFKKIGHQKSWSASLS